MTSVTTIICNFNHGRLIERALSALANQSRPVDELIVVDDASTDDSVAIIEAWADGRPAVRFLRNERNLGWHALTARALAASSSDYIYSGAADDYVLPGFFEAVCRLLDRLPETAVGCAQVITAAPDGRQLRTDGYHRWTEPRHYSPQEFLHQGSEAEPPTHTLSSATIYRREQLQEIGGFRPELGPWSDTFAIRALGLQTGVCYVPQPGTVWTRAPLGMSQSTSRDLPQSLAMVRRAAALMRLPEFQAVFPQDYVARWEHAFRDAIILKPLQPAIEAYQTIQQVFRETEAEAGWPVNWLLAAVRRCMTACYLTGHQLQRAVIRRKVERLEHPEPSAP